MSGSENLAFLFSNNAYTVKKQIAGIQVASREFIEAFLKYTDFDDYYAVCGSDAELRAFAGIVDENVDRQVQVHGITAYQFGRVKKVGTVFRPGPSIGQQ